MILLCGAAVWHQAVQINIGPEWKTARMQAVSRVLGNAQVQRPRASGRSADCQAPMPPSSQ